MSQNTSSIRFLLWIVLFLSVIGMQHTATAQAPVILNLYNSSFTTLCSFTGTTGACLGANPEGALLQGTDGYFYGTTRFGGTTGNGTVFKISSGGAYTVLHSFNSSDGAQPCCGLVTGTDGNFYGTTQLGGTSNLGTVFKMTPAGVLTTICTFTGTNGANPFSGLVNSSGTSGFFYGTTKVGGTSNFGTVYKISTSGSLTTLHTFNNTDGSTPYGVTLGNDGCLYGTTHLGGAVNNVGTIFKMTASGSMVFVHSLILSASYTNTYPYSPPIQGTDGNFYGTTSDSVNAGLGSVGGSVYQITASGSFTALCSFSGSATGQNLFAGLVQARDGNFYGTALSGGTSRYGTVYRVFPNGNISNLCTFSGTAAPSLGSLPYGSLVTGSDENLYGSTMYNTLAGGGYGTLFKITPYVTGTVGSAFTYQISAANTPTSYGALGLPCGLTVNTATGLISGTPTQTGKFNSIIAAINASGTGIAVLALRIPPFADYVDYYVNDNSLTNDNWCFAVGNDANDGLTPSTPKATVQAILDAHVLRPGDIVHIDTGIYTGGLQLSSSNSGNSASPVIFEGSPYGVTINCNACIAWDISASCVTIRTAAISNYPGRVQSFMKFTGSPNDIVFESTASYGTLSHLQMVNQSAGVNVYGASNITIENCLITGGDYGIFLGVQGTNFTIKNCTVAGFKIFGIGSSLASTLNLSNSIVIADGTSSYCFGGLPASSDYNDFQAKNGAIVGKFGTSTLSTLAAWQTATGMDTHSISTDPLFVNTASGDYHLKSMAGSFHGGTFTPDAANSPCIDAGDPFSSVGNEGVPNGNRINMGAFGGTEQASFTPPAPSITSSSMTTGIVGAQFSYTITADDGPNTYNATLLPDGLSVNTATGLISGTPTAAGTGSVTISAINAGGTGSATLTIVVQNPIDFWKSQKFTPDDLANPTISGDTVDPNQNGIPNLLEYALNGDPKGNIAETGILPQVSVSGSSNCLQVAFIRYLDRNDITITVQAADDLNGSWTDLASSVNGGGFSLSTPGATVLETGTGNTRAVTVTDLYPTTDPAHPKRFLRMKVSR